MRMKTAFAGMILAFCMNGAGAASADDFVSVCKANRPSGLPADAISSEQFCGCVDAQTTGNDKLRTEFLASFKITEMQKRGQSLSDEGRAVVMKCGAHGSASYGAQH